MAKKQSGAPEERTIVLASTGKSVDENAVARILARRLTNGDYQGYIQEAMRENHAEGGPHGSQTFQPQTPAPDA